MAYQSAAWPKYRPLVPNIGLQVYVFLFGAFVPPDPVAMGISERRNSEDVGEQNEQDG
jgi:hypothetical protein